ncbi:RtcB family protein [Yinghuangia sp. ASG 101]|uniref:RtcB family protein n=1 Tax=Yinghuangia sp. ASG 101 TaxID=2896848 RepID=UPI001E58C50B|nr:RtcB family protein [Yinghuangia sp. ASG 101]UGQ14765.1 RtcB family protein [Yinghuangia sp. ASG 101]
MTYTEIPGARDVPMRMWTDPSQIESQARQQLDNITTLPWLHGLAVMPDVHYGRGATVGSVIAMKDAVCPAAVGVDIGCGVSAVRTSLRAQDLPDDLRPLRSRIEEAIPVGFAAHREVVAVDKLPGLSLTAWDALWDRFGDLAPEVHARRERAGVQIGSLGSGNHYVSLDVDESGLVWLQLHSGSRNIGKELAEHHIGVARSLPHNQGLVDRDLAVFVANTPEMEAYRRDLYWAQEYARFNRDVMLALYEEVIRAFFGKSGAKGRKKVWFDERISCHHNYVAEETYDGVDVLVTRKGAIRAGRGELGIIPGSMAAGSYVVRGLGNVLAFNSASHGAGRKMSRNAARKRFTVGDLVRQTEGVECRKDAGVVDEIPGAYKNLKQVMRQQEDLVEVVTHLRPLITVKG